VDEPIHPVLGKNPKFYSHKFKQAALLYELVKFYRYRDEKARKKREEKKKKHEKVCK
jgi:hypothetical protein